MKGRSVGAVVRALVSHQCVLGFNSLTWHHTLCGLSLLSVLYSAPRGFSPGTPVFPSPHKPTFLRPRSFGVIWIRISHPRSVWIMVHQRNRWIHDQSGFVGSIDALWSRHILDYPKGTQPKFQFDLDYCQAFYHEPLALVIVQALPVLDVKVTFKFYIFYMQVKASLPEAILDRCLLNLSSSSGNPVM